MLTACVLCHKISSGRYMTKEQDHMLEENDSLTVNVFMKKSYSKEYKTKLECRKVICGANHSKIWAHIVWSLALLCDPHLCLSFF